jgi:hypothetical protein
VGDKYSGEERRQGSFEGTVLEKLENIEERQASMHLMLCGEDGMSGMVGRVNRLEKFNERIKGWGVAVVVTAGGIGGGASQGIKKVVAALTGH